MVGIDDTYAAEGLISREQRNPNGRKKKRNLLLNLKGQEVTVVANGFEKRGVLAYEPREGVYVSGIKLPITAVKRIYADQRTIRLYGATL